MKVTLDKIASQPSDYKICKECGYINFYENEVCVMCQGDEFDESEESVIRWVDNEYQYRIETEGYTEREADNVVVEV
ncbi:hypothetical protein BCF55_0985 [Hydrogenivirga caldilitoris]|uniref:Uncharacterized protein n=1 Tax=Hydrogenivirga caldilitoris TaxID=246264 RepID=A0A497XR17_9AQUI|nr:hypothetical protein [Hydrogenivirga caldilitoris]RLJ70704.1 hypothetical protein BCF55_0985 [Hydrogenivirga caldilitoris]